jgi:hypothetical protein
MSVHPHGSMCASITRHPEVLGAPFVRRASKGARPGPSSFEGLATLGHLRVTE